jgi:hypothetical protein
MVRCCGGPGPLSGSSGSALRPPRRGGDDRRVHRQAHRRWSCRESGKRLLRSGATWRRRLPVEVDRPRLGRRGGDQDPDKLPNSNGPDRQSPPEDTTGSDATRLDTTMLVFTGSRERTEGEYRDLLRRAGLTLLKTTPTASPFSILGQTCPRRTALKVPYGNDRWRVALQDARVARIGCVIVIGRWLARDVRHWGQVRSSSPAGISIARHRRKDLKAWSKDLAEIFLINAGTLSRAAVDAPLKAPET